MPGCIENWLWQTRMSLDHEQLARLFHQALALTNDAERQQFIQSQTESQPELRAELASLLAAHEASEGFLEEPAVAEAANLIPQFLGSRLVGQSIGAWRLDSLIDSGGMGSVFRATRIEQDFTQPGALKLVRLDFQSSELLQHFSRERQLLASVEHPHIARLLDGGTTSEGLPWLAMEYVDGLPLDVYADHHCLSLSQRLDLFDQLGDAIAHLHQRLIIHRDIKFSNVLVDSNGHVRVLDFGIANLLGETAASHEDEGGRRLSVASAAPEQLLGQPASTATDIYALGVMLYRLLVGAPPYRIEGAMSEAEIERVICEQVPPLASAQVRSSEDPGAVVQQRRSTRRQLHRALSGDLDLILAKTLHKDPAQRYGSVAELRADLQRYRQYRPILARPDSRFYRSQKFVRRHWRGLVATSLVMVALAVGLTAALWQADKARHQRDRAEAINSFMQDLLGEADPYTADENRTVRDVLGDASAQLDERFADKPLLEAAIRQSVGSVQLSLMDLDGGEINLLRARELLEAATPNDIELRTRVEADLAWLAYEREDYAGSVAAYEALLDELGNSPLTELRALIHNDIGVALAALERWEDMIQHQHEAMRLDPESPERVATLGNLGRAYDGLGQLEDAKKYYLEAISMLRGQGQRGVTAYLAHALNNYGNILYQQGNSEEALDYYRQSLGVRNQVYGVDSDSAARQHLNIGRLLLTMDRPTDAQPHLERSTELILRYREPDSMFVLVSRASLARAVALNNPSPEKFAAARDTLGEVLEALRSSEQLRVSRYVEQTEQWFNEAQSAIEE